MAQKLSQAILNYFAAFTETRFNFQRLTNYAWSDDELTLDLAPFTEFLDLLLGRLESGDRTPVTIEPGVHQVRVSADTIRNRLLVAFDAEYGHRYLEKSIVDAGSKVETIAVDHVGVADVSLPAANRDEGIRIYYRALRGLLERTLIECQEGELQGIRADNFDAKLPHSNFNLNHYLNQFLDGLKKIPTNVDDSALVNSVRSYCATAIGEVIIYDLYHVIHGYLQYLTTGTAYVFFHELRGENGALPLYFVEIEAQTKESTITIAFPRDLALINTPAVNIHKIGQILTTQRSASFTQFSGLRTHLERHLQVPYGMHAAFLSARSFPSISPPEEHPEWPTIQSRVGIQVIQKEDKRLLDYSEILARLGAGMSSGFSGIVDAYMKGTVENTTREIDRSYLQEFPVTSAGRYVSDNPLPLNDAQRRILRALEHDKNKIIVVDGPPGTGKSHTIAAIAYWANQKRKTFMVASHKGEALDVVERMLSDKFSKIHPTRRPSILRLSENTQSPHRLDIALSPNTLTGAQTATNEAHKDAWQLEAATSRAELEREIANLITDQGVYPEQLLDVFEFERQSVLLKDQLGLEMNPSEMVNAQTGTCCSIEDLQFLSQRKSEVWRNVPLSSLLELSEHADQISLLRKAIRALADTGLTQAAWLEATSSGESVRLACDRIVSSFAADNKISALDVRKAGGVLSRILRSKSKKQEINRAIMTLQDDDATDLLADIATRLGKEPLDLAVADLAQFKEALNVYSQYPDAWQTLTRIMKSMKASTIRQVSDVLRDIESIDPKVFRMHGEALKHLSAYDLVLLRAEISVHDVSTFKAMLQEKYRPLMSWIALHGRIAARETSVGLLPLPLRDRLNELQLKLAQLENDERLADALSSAGMLQQIRHAYINKKRFTAEQAALLLKTFSCIIAEPEMITRYFPMDENLVDVLVFDEASQVSIAESISVILRAERVVVFGDEYQYGAVGAVNVSKTYAGGYFRDILSAFSAEKGIPINTTEVERIISDVTAEYNDDEVIPVLAKPDEGSLVWLETFNVRTSTLAFARAISNYATSLRDHFRSFPEIIGYSNEFFYKKAALELVMNRIRTKPIGEVLVFKKVQCQGLAGDNVNIDEIAAIVEDIKMRIEGGYKGTIGIIASFREQTMRIREALEKELNMHSLQEIHKMAVWFVGDVQGEERDLIYYSFVEDKAVGNADLRSIYPVIGGTADNIRNLKMQRLNVGFSRAKDTMVFVHSMPLEEYSNTRLGDALKYYRDLLESTAKNDLFVVDESVFGSPMEHEVYRMLLETDFVKQHQEHIKIIPQFEVGKYIRAEYHKYIPKYRTDFLVTLSEGGKDAALILEYDGVEYHFKDPETVTKHSYPKEYVEYDVQRQIELQQYGYKFLRLNKFNLRPQQAGQTQTEVLDSLLKQSFAIS